jgi:hypothetical protein
MLLVELLDDYKETTDKQERKDLLNEFIYELWHSRCEYRKLNKSFKINIKEDGIYNDDFLKYKEITYKIFKSRYINDDLSSIDYIRIAINNSYAYLFDSEVYYKKEYYKLLTTPSVEYNKLYKNKVTLEESIKNINEALEKAEQIKRQSINKKIELKWNEYKKLINFYITKCFDNYISVDEYEEKNGWNDDNGFYNEDNYVIGYFIRSIRGYLLNYYNQKKERKRWKTYIECCNCGKEIEKKSNRTKYCNDCAREMNIKKTIENRKNKELFDLEKTL